MFVLVTLTLILYLSVCVDELEMTVCGLILLLSVCVGDLEMDSVWINP